MNKNTKMILGVGAVAIVGYLVWKQMSKPKASFANLTAPIFGGPAATICCGHTASYPNPNSASGYTYKCCNGEFALDSYGKDCNTPTPEGCKGLKTKTKTGNFVGR
jgi:hypothetical protein